MTDVDYSSMNEDDLSDACDDGEIDAIIEASCRDAKRFKEETDALKERVRRAAELLRDWRDKYGGQEVYRVRNFGTLTGASPTDLLRDTQKWIEGK